jgi:hypothetical protein
MVFNSIGHLLKTSESILVEEPKMSYPSALFETLVPGVVTASDRRRFSKVQKRWPIAKKYFDRMDRALERELWRDGAVRAGIYDAKNTSIFSLKYDPCRSEPARDGVVSDNKNVE